MEFLVKGRGKRSTSRAPLGLRLNKLAVHEPLYFPFLPFNSEGVEIIGKIPFRKFVFFSRRRVFGPGIPIVQCPQHFVGVLSTKLHDVDFAALRPSAIFVTCWQHPYRWPEPCPSRQLGPHFDASIFPVTAILGANPPRGILPRGAHHIRVVAAGFQNQVPSPNTNIFFPVGENLQLSIATSECIHLNAPL